MYDARPSCSAGRGHGHVPVRNAGGDLAELRAMLNVTAETWPLVLGWLVAALVPNMPHPILLLGGQQGTGKSTAAEQLVALVDPSPACIAIATA